MTYVFVHGAGQDASSWTQVIAQIGEPLPMKAPNLFTLLGTNEPTYQNVYQAFYEYCESFHAPIHLCGLSLGAILSLHYAIDRPEKVCSLSLIAAHSKMPKLLISLQRVVFQFLPQSVFQQAGISKKTMIQLTNSMKHLDFRSQLETIKCPSLIACGEYDKANQKASTQLAATLKNAQMVMIEKAGHEVNAANPKLLASVLRQFWQTIE